MVGVETDPDLPLTTCRPGWDAGRPVFDKIKIDQSFVRELGKDAEGLSLLGAILNLGISLGVEVLTEGVETEEQLDIIRSLGGVATPSPTAAPPASPDPGGFSSPPGSGSIGPP